MIILTFFIDLLVTTLHSISSTESIPFTSKASISDASPFVPIILWNKFKCFKVEFDLRPFAMATAASLLN